jgi:uncharacterized delta-60 repeat protein
MMQKRHFDNALNRTKYIFSNFKESILTKNRTKDRLPALTIMLAFFILVLIFSSSAGVAQSPSWSPARIDILVSSIHDRIASLDLLESDVYLPMVFNNFPNTPTAPILDPIDNTDGDDSYTVSWSFSAGAQSYTLQEDDNAAFSSPITAYLGSATSKAISGKEPGTYYYRVMASNDYASSGWSNVQSVVVSQAAPPCPQTGSWLGNTSQSYSISFAVEDSPQCQIAGGSLEISFLTWCGYLTVQTGPTTSFPIINDTFSTGEIADKVRITGEFTSSSTAEGTFDVLYDFNCQARGTWEAYPVSGADGPVNAIAVQADDAKILVGGDFSEVGGQSHNNLARLNPDGSLDTTFNPDFDGEVFSLVVQNDKKILVGGDFTLVNGQAHAGLARLNQDGSLDTSFNAQIDGDVYALALQSTGKILFGGFFSSVNEVQRENFARLNPDGTLDDTFVVGYVDSGVFALVVQPDDKILVGGRFNNLYGEWYADYFVRLFPDGGLDIVPNLSLEVSSIALQPDGKIVVASDQIARFNSDGTVDDGFKPPQADNYVGSLGLLSDGRIIMEGYFTLLDSLSIKYLALLNSDGTLIPSFNPEPNNSIFALAVQQDNKILVGGEFSIINGQVRHSIVRLNPDGSLDETFVVGP